MISSAIFPGYFIKETPEAAACIDSGVDVEILAKIVAALLNITIRFVGEESFGIVTKKYNEKTKEVLPLYDIKLIEIPRKHTKNKEDMPISASLVRQYLKQKDFVRIKELVSETTYTYLLKKFK